MKDLIKRMEEGFVDVKGTIRKIDGLMKETIKLEDALSDLLRGINGSDEYDELMEVADEFSEISDKLDKILYMVKKKV